MKRILLLVAVVALVATACGGTADADDGVASLDDTTPLGQSDVSSAPEMTDEEALFAFAACLRDLGLDVEDPTVDAEGNLQISRPAPSADGSAPQVDREAVRAECGQFLENVSLGFRDQDQTEVEDQLLEFAICMRENGYEEMPDPDLSGLGAPGQGGGGPFGQLDRDDPAFQEAAEACQDVLSGFGRGGGGRGGQGNG